MLDAGLVFIVSAAELRADDLDILRVSVPAEQLVTVWYGPAEAAEIAPDLSLPAGATVDEACAAMAGLLTARGVLPS
jgi:bifunctional enzyme CysN/CysC